jgi:hypothetical protein
MWEARGSISISGSTVTGVGTYFSARCRDGDCFIGPDGLAYEVMRVLSNTTLIISPDYRSGSVTDSKNFTVLHTQEYDVPSHDKVRDFLDSVGTIPNIPAWLNPFDRETFKGMISDAQGAETIPIADNNGKLNSNVFDSKLLRAAGTIPNSVVPDSVIKDKVTLGQIPELFYTRMWRVFTG